MRRTSKIAAIAVVASMALTGCGKKTTARQRHQRVAGDICKTAKGDGPKVGLAYDVGGRGDQSFNDSAYAGVSKAVKELRRLLRRGRGPGRRGRVGPRGPPAPDGRRTARPRSSASASPTATRSTPWPPNYPDISFAVVDGFDPDNKPNTNVAYLAFAAERVLLPRGCGRRADDEDQPGRLRRRRPQRPDQGLRGRLHRGCQGRQPEHQGRRRLHPGEQPRPASATRPVARPPRPASSTRAPTWSTTPPAPRAAASSTPRSRPATASGRSAWTPTSTSPRPPHQKPHILTSALKRVDVASYDWIKTVDDGYPVTGYLTYDLKNDGVGYATSGGFLDSINEQDRRLRRRRSRAARSRSRPLRDPERCPRRRARRTVHAPPSPARE